jgi:hypothetical protein
MAVRNRSSTSSTVVIFTPSGYQLRGAIVPSGMREWKCDARGVSSLPSADRSSSRQQLHQETDAEHTEQPTPRQPRASRQGPRGPGGKRPQAKPCANFTAKGPEHATADV